MPDMRKVETISYGDAHAALTGVDTDIRRLLQRRFIAFDTETTGLDPDTDRIAEVAALIFEDGKIIDRFRSYVNPGVSIPENVSALNHISNELLEKAPQPEAVYPKLLAFLGDAVSSGTLICGHVTAFDLSFLCRELSLLGLRADLRFVDTRRLAVENPALESHSLAAVAEYYRIPHEHAHRAEEDAAVAGRILLRMLQESAAKEKDISKE